MKIIRVRRAGIFSSFLWKLYIKYKDRIIYNVCIKEVRKSEVESIKGWLDTIPYERPKIIKINIIVFTIFEIMRNTPSHIEDKYHAKLTWYFLLIFYSSFDATLKYGFSA